MPWRSSCPRPAVSLAPHSQEAPQPRRWPGRHEDAKPRATSAQVLYVAVFDVALIVLPGVDEKIAHAIQALLAWAIRNDKAMVVEHQHKPRRITFRRDVAA